MANLIATIADNPNTLARGLMGVKKLPTNEGMLFKFPMFLEAGFWGKDTYIPLDIAFIDVNNRITAIKEITPMSTRSVRSDNGQCVMALETNLGFFKQNDVDIGHEITIVSKGDKKVEISFKKD